MDIEIAALWGFVLIILLFAGALLFNWLGLILLVRACVIGLMIIGGVAWVVLMLNAPW